MFWSLVYQTANNQTGKGLPNQVRSRFRADSCPGRAAREPGDIRQIFFARLLGGLSLIPNAESGLVGHRNVLPGRVDTPATPYMQGDTRGRLGFTDRLPWKGSSLSSIS